jgi:hypothetical protein
MISESCAIAVHIAKSASTAWLSTSDTFDSPVGHRAVRREDPSTCPSPLLPSGFWIRSARLIGGAIVMIWWRYGTGSVFEEFRWMSETMRRRSLLYEYYISYAE